MTRICSEITPDFLAQAEQELFEIIFQQRDAFSTRWRNSVFYRKARPFLRWTGIALSLLGIVLCVYAFVMTPDWCPAHTTSIVMLLLFAGFFMLFYSLPTLEIRLQHHLGKWIANSCRKQAAKCVEAARQQVPFTAEYLLENGSITYSRVKEGQSTLVWTRKLSGVAFHRKLVTLIYKKPASLVPQITILHEDAGAMTAALKEQGVT